MGTPTPAAVQRSLGDLAENLRTWRKLNGLTQDLLAQRGGISAQTVRALERDPGSVSVENLFRVLRALGVLGGVVSASDPLETDVGRLRADERLPQRVRRRRTAP